MDVRPSPGELAFLDSELRVTGASSFEENGTVMFGENSEHLLHFSTIGQGRFTTGHGPGTMTGTVVCNIEGGEGEFAAACGFISSTFTLSGSGELINLHSGLIFLPETSANEMDPWPNQSASRSTQ